MVSHSEPIQKKKRVKKQKKYSKKKLDNVDTSDYGHTYGIKRLNLDEPEN